MEGKSLADKRFGGEKVWRRTSLAEKRFGGKTTRHSSRDAESKGEWSVSGIGPGKDMEGEGVAENMFGVEKVWRRTSLGEKRFGGKTTRHSSRDAERNGKWSVSGIGPGKDLEGEGLGEKMFGVEKVWRRKGLAEKKFGGERFGGEKVWRE